MQTVLTFDDLPSGAIDAATTFHRDHIGRVQMALSSEIDALAILLPSAPRDHDEWRRALARDLARSHAPKRVNVIGASDEKVRQTLLEYLGGAPGITGQYLPTHE